MPDQPPDRAVMDRKSRGEKQHAFDQDDKKGKDHRRDIDAGRRPRPDIRHVRRRAFGTAQDNTNDHYPD